MADQASDRSQSDHDKVLEDSFPASDPPAKSGITSAEPPDKDSGQRTMDERPTGLPNSDRHAVETAHQWEHEQTPAEKQNRA